MWRPQDAWLAAGVRTPFSRVDGALQALELSVPVARHMAGMLKGGRPDFAVGGVVVPR
jgi:acetyl-CoA C-acetyltransferase